MMMMSASRRSGPGKIKTRRDKGAATVEFALLAPLFFFLVFIVIELGILFWVNLTMQYAVREGARYAITGQSNLDPDTANPQRYQAVLQKIRNSSMGLYTRVNPTVVVNGVSQAPGSYSASMFGVADSLVVLQLDCNWPVVTPAWRLMALLNPGGQASPPGQYAFSVAATMRNEAFP
jgi:Flp pilus assembly protein TadG